jgi:hypothetical protein
MHSCGTGKLKLEEITASSCEVVQLLQRPTESAASRTPLECRGGRIYETRYLDRETAAILANDVKVQSLARGVFSARHARFHQHAIRDVR